jgi:hypothetical protein
MRCILAITAICCATVSSYGESTAKLLGACMGLEMRQILTPGNRIMSPDAVDSPLKEKCGYLVLEEKHEKGIYGIYWTPVEWANP